MTKLRELLKIYKDLIISSILTISDLQIHWHSEFLHHHHLYVFDAFSSI